MIPITKIIYNEYYYDDDYEKNLKLNLSLKGIRIHLFE
jgi:hypothetical protein